MKTGHLKRKLPVVFQSSIFRCHVSFREGIWMKKMWTCLAKRVPILFHKRSVLPSGQSCKFMFCTMEEVLWIQQSERDWKLHKNKSNPKWSINQNSSFRKQNPIPVGRWVLPYLYIAWFHTLKVVQDFVPCIKQVRIGEDQTTLTCLCDTTGMDHQSQGSMFLDPSEHGCCTMWQGM